MVPGVQKSRKSYTYIKFPRVLELGGRGGSLGTLNFNLFASLRLPAGPRPQDSAPNTMSFLKTPISFVNILKLPNNMSFFGICPETEVVAEMLS